jgi:hypothetical protein
MKEYTIRRLNQLSRKLGKNNVKFYMLYHKKHKRAALFRNTPESIRFIKRKFNSPFKKIIYTFIKLKVLQLFIRKINLSSELGDAIFIGNQIKGFRLRNKEVISFPLEVSTKSSFLKNKKFQRKVGAEGFAPQIKVVNVEKCFSVEPLLLERHNMDYRKIFSKLLNYYGSKGISFKSLGEVCRTEDSKKDIKSSKKILVTKVHGDFAKQQVLFNEEGEPFFVDWEPRIAPITEDLFSFFKNDKDGSKKIKSLVKLYPKHVQDNFEIYLSLFKSKKK